MNLAVFSTNISFFADLGTVLTNRGHTVAYYNPTDSIYDNGVQLGAMVQWADAYFVEFCQDPIIEVIAKGDPNKPIFARMHRIEAYNAYSFDPKFKWDRISVLFVSAEHVLNRFLEHRGANSKPKQVFISPTNVIDVNKFKFKSKNWQNKIRMCIVGNLVPKKRQYSLIEMMVDTPDNFVLDIIGSRNAFSGYGNPEYFQNCLDLIKDRKLENKVFIYDKILHNKMPEFLYNEHIIVSHSNEEGTHVSIAEAMCSGCLAFVSAWRGARTVYGDCCLLYESPAKFLSLCKEVQDYIADDTIQNEVLARSKQAITKFGCWEKLYNSMVDIMEKEIKNK